MPSEEEPPVVNVIAIVVLTCQLFLPAELRSLALLEQSGFTFHYQLLGSQQASLPPFRRSPLVPGRRQSPSDRSTAQPIRTGTYPSSSAAACGSWRRRRRSPSGTAGTWCTAHSSTCSTDSRTAPNVKMHPRRPRPKDCPGSRGSTQNVVWGCAQRGAHLVGVRKARVNRRRLRLVGDERLLDSCH